MSEEPPQFDTSYGPPPPPEQREAARTILPMPPAYVRTLADRLPDGLSDPGGLPPPLKLPEPLVLIKPREPQEPAFGRVTRMSLADQHPLLWMVERLGERYPTRSPALWAQWLRQYITLNNTFFMKTERAVVLAVRSGDPLSGVPFVDLMFLLHRDVGPEGGNIKGTQGEREAIRLVRELRNWAKLTTAAEIRVSGVSDLPAGVYVKEFKGERAEVMRIPLT